MVWSYSGDPASSEIDAVRFEVGDTDPSDQLLQDEEVQYALDSEEGVLPAAARCCEVLARRFAREADRRLGPLSVSLSQKSKAYSELAKELRDKASLYQTPYLGSLLKADETADKEDTTLKQPAFRRGMMSNPEVESEE